MKKHIRNRLLSAALLGLLPLAISATAQTSAVPQQTNFQGRLAKPDGTALPDGVYGVTFQLWNDPTATNNSVNLMWQYTASVTTRNSVFATRLDFSAAAGKYVNGFNFNSVFSGPVYLQILVGGIAQSPRQQLASVPYAFVAQSVANGAITGSSLAPGLLNPLAWLLGGNSGTNPSSAFLGTTDNQPLAFRANNVEGMRLLPNGSLGIGTQSPQQTLSVAGGLVVDQSAQNTGSFNKNGAAGNGLSFGSNSGEGIASSRASGSSNYNGLDFYTNYNPRLSITNGGNIGVGTSNPGAKLDVSGTLNVNGVVSITGANYLQFGAGVANRQTDAGKMGYSVFTANALDIVGAGTTASNRAIKFWNEGGATFTGGVSLPALQLTSGAGAGKILTSDASGNATWQIAAPGGATGNAGGDLTGTYPSPAITANAVSNGKLASDAASLAKVSGGVMVNSSGNIGVGTSSPQQILSVAGGLVVDASGQNASSFNQNGAAGYGISFGSGAGGEGIASARAGSNNVNGLDFYTAYNPRLSITNGGNVGLGNTNPNTPLAFSSGDGNKINLGADLRPYGGWAGIGLSSNITQFYSNSYNGGFAFGEGYYGAFAESMRIMPRNGGNNVQVGIGTTNPQGTLDVNGTIYVNGSDSYQFNYGYLNGGGHVGVGNSPSPYSIVATNRIAASEFNATSDERIKNRIGRSDPSRDLDTLLGIEVTDYTMKDTVAQGNRHFKKVIAQQVEGVYPQAVTKTTGVIPDIYQKAKIENGWVKLATNLKVGDKARLITKDRIELYTVKEIGADGFRVEGLSGSQNVFVYGREVNDLRTVDYDALAMLNVSATQGLYRLLEAQQKQINDLKASNEELKKQNAVVETLQTQLEALAKAMQKLQRGNAP